MLMILSSECLTEVLCSAFVEPLVILLILVANGERLLRALREVDTCLTPGIDVMRDTETNTDLLLLQHPRH